MTCNISKGQGQIWLNETSNFYMVEYCEFCKMTFAKILDFLRGLTTRSEAPAWKSYDWESQNGPWGLDYVQGSTMMVDEPTTWSI